MGSISSVLQTAGARTGPLAPGASTLRLQLRCAAGRHCSTATCRARALSHATPAEAVAKRKRVDATHECGPKSDRGGARAGASGGEAARRRRGSVTAWRACPPRAGAAQAPPRSCEPSHPTWAACISSSRLQRVMRRRVMLRQRAGQGGGAARASPCRGLECSARDNAMPHRTRGVSTRRGAPEQSPWARHPATSVADDPDDDHGRERRGWLTLACGVMRQPQHWRPRLVPPGSRLWANKSGPTRTRQPADRSTNTPHHRPSPSA